jgi:hypothetical protein
MTNEDPASLALAGHSTAPDEGAGANPYTGVMVIHGIISGIRISHGAQPPVR